MAIKYVSPSIESTSFNCPHCGALAAQAWLQVNAKRVTKGTPRGAISKEDIDRIKKDTEIDDESRREILNYAMKRISGRPVLHKDDNYNIPAVLNLWLSECYNCEQLTVWLNESILYPVSGDAPPPNEDLPESIRNDYLEASSILNLSPRGAASLLRLAIQKLCIELGQPGKNLNADIGALVARGLDVRVQKALDVVRVIGNNAVHPGELDFNDSRATAESLFKLVNVIAEKLITEPRHVNEIYESLPEGARRQITNRDGTQEA